MFYVLVILLSISCKPKPNEENSKTLLGRTITNNLWANATIPYKISEKFTQIKKTQIANAIKEVDEKTVLKLVPLEKFKPGYSPSSKKEYIYFEPHETSCSSPIGRSIGKHNTLKIAEWCKEGSIMHEILHSAGFNHEQLNPSAGIKFNFSKVQTGYEHNFKINSRTTYAIDPHDLNSIMHYHSWGFTICDKLDDKKWQSQTEKSLPHTSCKTKNWRSKTRLNNWGVNCKDECAVFRSNKNKWVESQREGLSEFDIRSINKVYSTVNL